MNARRWLWRVLRGIQEGQTARPWTELRITYESAQMVVRLFYGATLYLVSANIRQWARWLEHDAVYPLWPVAWISLTGLPLAVHLIMTATFAALILVSLVPHRRILRVAAFVALLEYVGLAYSFGRLGHGWHAWLAIALLFTLLPPAPRGGAGSLAVRQRYLLVVWAALASLLLTYTLSGFWKVYYGVLQWWLGEPNSFSPSAFAIHIAKKLVWPPATSLVGPFIIEHPTIGWLPYLGAIYLECCSLIVAFRPALHRVWGVALIVFHIGSYLTMTILFSANILLLALFCIGSPFAPATLSWSAAARALPGVGLVRAAYRRLRPAVSYAGPM